MPDKGLHKCHITRVIIFTWVIDIDKDFRAIYKILKYLKSAMDYDETDIEQISSKVLGISENRWFSRMEMLANNG